MKLLVEVEVETTTGTYDVRFKNLDSPGDKIDVVVATKLVNKIMDNVLKEENNKKINEEEYTTFDIPIKNLN